MNNPVGGALFLPRAATWLTFAAAASILFSIALWQILLALALAALFLSGEPLRFPRIKLPLALFLAGTLIALAFSGHIAEGLPQVRKIYVFSLLLVVFSALRSLKVARWLFLTWAGFAAVSAARGVVQFVQKVQMARELHQNVYAYYVGERITGFTNHWNTFSAQEMFALLMLAAFLFFGPPVKKRGWVWILFAAFIAVAVLLAETRAVWIATAIGGLYLVWFWRRWLVLLVPVAIVAAFFVSPAVIRDRFTSMVHPQDVDSNAFRLYTWRAGVSMVEAHPLLGLGPEGPHYQFDRYAPTGTPRPEGWYGHLHNIYLQYAAERGIPTMLVMMWMLGQILYDFWRGLRALPPGRGAQRFLLHGAIAVVLATLAEGFFEYNLGISNVLAMFLVVVACGYLALEKDVAPE
ncbi:MAG TPA: O-antigen ligase family protein [Bryobacteraceae bacterium]|nr:O-antigen ligase family protein [Bryobacteraceae bacterium]